MSRVKTWQVVALIFGLWCFVVEAANIGLVKDSVTNICSQAVKLTNTANVYYGAAYYDALGNQIGESSGKADKVSGATDGNFAGLDAIGNLTDSGWSWTSFLNFFVVSQESIPYQPAYTLGNLVQIAKFEEGNAFYIQDTGKKISDYSTAAEIAAQYYDDDEIAAILASYLTSAEISEAYYSKAEITAKLADYLTAAEIASEYYTQDQIVANFAGIAHSHAALDSATDANTASTIVKRDASGNFSASTITANITGNVSGSSGSCTGNAATATSATSITGNLSGDVTSTGMTTAIASGVIVNNDISSSAAIADTKLATISTAGKVSNSATTATSSLTNSAIVARDASGNFSAATISANLTATTISAGSSTGISIKDNGGNYGIFVKDGGNVGIGTSDPSAKLYVYRASGVLQNWTQSDSLADTEYSRFIAGGKKSGGAARYTGIMTYYNASSSSNEACGAVFFDPSDGTDNYMWVDDADKLRISTTAAHIGTTNGTVVGDQTSDRRLKKAIQPLEYGLKEIIALEPIRFKYKDQADPEKHIGFVAQDVKKVIPEAVYATGNPVEDDEGELDSDNVKRKRDGLAMRYVDIVPVLVNAIKEQQAQIILLEKRIQALEAR